MIRAAGSSSPHWVRALGVLVLALPLAACVTNPFTPPPPAGGTAVGRGTPRGDAKEEVFKQFTDIPIPVDADLAIEESLVEDSLVHRYRTAHAAPDGST